MKNYRITITRSQVASITITARDVECAHNGVNTMIDFYPNEIVWEVSKIPSIVSVEELNENTTSD